LITRDNLLVEYNLSITLIMNNYFRIILIILYKSLRLELELKKIINANA